MAIISKSCVYCGGYVRPSGRTYSPCGGCNGCTSRLTPLSSLSGGLDKKSVRRTPDLKAAASLPTSARQLGDARLEGFANRLLEGEQFLPAIPMDIPSGSCGICGQQPPSPLCTFCNPEAERLIISGGIW
jgi:hypothetical protein